MSCRVLAVGPVLGSFREIFAKVKAMDEKHGKFDLLLCTGDFFAKEGEGEEALDELLAGSLDVPMHAYVMQGTYPLPQKVIKKAEETSGGYLCPNLYLLGKSSVTLTPQGIRIACIGGAYDRELYKSGKGLDHAVGHFTAQTVKSLVSHPSITRPALENPNSLAAAKAASTPLPLIDILLTNPWPLSIDMYSTGKPPEISSSNYLSDPLNEVVLKAKPRYHFASLPGKFWEREPFMWEAEENRVTRFISLGSFGEVTTGKKQRWFYAFSITTASSISQQPKLPNVTKNPFQAPSLNQAQKRPSDETSENFIWNDTGKPPKKSRTDSKEGKSKPCRKCGAVDHTIRDCPEKETPPEGYVCRKCQEPGHYVKDCPVTGDTGGKKPKEGYVCRACGSDQHFIQDCPVANDPSRGRHHDDGGRKRKGPPREIRPDECWFCLSNPRLAKHLIVTIGTECYVTLPKGQLPYTGHKADKDWTPVPGGGHVLIVPIEHHPTLHTLPEDVRSPILDEIEKTTAALKECYKSFGAVPVVFEIARLSGMGGHAHVQVVPIPARLKDEVEAAFSKDPAVVWEQDPEAALRDAAESKRDYFRVALPDGRQMVHMISGFFNLQFGRFALANLMGAPDRVDWKACIGSDEAEEADTKAFQAAFTPFDPSS
ncbi:hypothetical protein SISSUDRAFT_1003698, partial [Sistotremastrum suecicum HHB10207 ss-3]